MYALSIDLRGRPGGLLSGEGERKEKKKRDRHPSLLLRHVLSRSYLLTCEWKHACSFRKRHLQRGVRTPAIQRRGDVSFTKMYSTPSLESERDMDVDCQTSTSFCSDVCMCDTSSMGIARVYVH